MKSLRTFTILVVVSQTAFLMCAPPLYFIDRHSVMEVEAAGEWPELDQEMMEVSKKPGVTYYEKDQNTDRKNRIYNTLNGESTSQKKTAKKS